MEETIKSCPFCGKQHEIRTMKQKTGYDDRGNPIWVDTRKVVDISAHGIGETVYLLLDDWQKRPAEAEVERLKAAAKEALEWLQNAPFDYSNGNKDSTGTLDEGNVYGWQGHGEIIEKLEEALGETK